MKMCDFCLKPYEYICETPNCEGFTAGIRVLDAIPLASITKRKERRDKWIEKYKEDYGLVITDTVNDYDLSEWLIETADNLSNELEIALAKLESIPEENRKYIVIDSVSNPEGV